MPSAPAFEIDPDATFEVTITTDKGDIVMSLDAGLAPQTVNNFVVQARNGFYDGLTFHRVVPGFVIQGGDPDGTGRGGPGYRFADEPVKGAYTLGAVAMANAGPDTNGSQFFICIEDCQDKLQPLYNLFGYVTSGIEVAQAIAVGDKMHTVTVGDEATPPEG
jgi:cyclophilin family peptidyl-prolyl cis-trans isomerase